MMKITIQWTNVFGLSGINNNSVNEVSYCIYRNLRDYYVEMEDNMFVLCAYHHSWQTVSSVFDEWKMSTTDVSEFDVWLFKDIIIIGKGWIHSEKQDLYWFPFHKCSILLAGFMYCSLSGKIWIINFISQHLHIISSRSLDSDSLLPFLAAC